MICRSIKPAEMIAPPQSTCRSASRRSSKNTFSGSTIRPSRTQRSTLVSRWSRRRRQLVNWVSGWWLTMEEAMSSNLCRLPLPIVGELRRISWIFAVSSAFYDYSLLIGKRPGERKSNWLKVIRPNEQWTYFLIRFVVINLLFRSAAFFSEYFIALLECCLCFRFNESQPSHTTRCILNIHLMDFHSI